VTAALDRCGTVRASLFYGAPILSEVGARVREFVHPGDNRDARGSTWCLIPLVPVLPSHGDEKNPYRPNGGECVDRGRVEGTGAQP